MEATDKKSTNYPTDRLEYIGRQQRLITDQLKVDTYKFIDI